MRKLSMLLAMLAGSAVAQQAADAVQPEVMTPVAEAAQSPAVAAAYAAKAAGRPVEAAHWMVAAANPLAVEAGAKVLAAGGSAADALVAVQTVLGLVEPQSSGLGGGAFLLWYDASTGALTTIDARETAPLAATPLLFLDAAGQPLKFFDAVVGGRSVGTPGTPALLEDVHRRWGRLPWASLFDPAIGLAREGFAVSERLNALIAEDRDRLASAAGTSAYFLTAEGEPLPVGYLLQNPDYADTLALMAAGGAEAFYTGPVAADIVRAVQGALGNPGVLAATDLALYEVKERAPVCAVYRVYEVCGMGPPSSGGITVGQILGTLNGAPMGPADAPETWRRIGDASRLAFADRERFIADSDFTPVPSRGLLDPAYLAGRAALLEGGKALEDVQPGSPEFDHAWADGEAIELPSTSHVTIVDQYGNVAAMTASIENVFGARLMVRGFLLNNELTDFSFRSHREGVPVANRVEPGKRPRSSMAPTVVMQDGKPVLAIGSPGGSRIIGYVARAIIAWADWGMDVQQAVSMGHGLNRFGTFDLESGTEAEALKDGLEGLGFEVKVQDLNSGLHAIEIGAMLKGGADPRREGIALGD
ncbi:gamma-glutamyltransferase [Seohaeicola zhoushanensis]|uniref:Glutathione hydrolase proenzyme n=1 Tax=Seohaeicola zhoushanensis TaxID=1569283 RepID=A0A8J3GTQ7_9RHOB|nr:gamma-glutamyltransferase [Seohaeicola zhoushanensis]GHF32836.1 gamma-glutamyltransferase [Seohaeicola zhoushanensis]